MSGSSSKVRQSPSIKKSETPEDGGRSNSLANVGRHKSQSTRTTRLPVACAAHTARAPASDDLPSSGRAEVTRTTPERPRLVGTWTASETGRAAGRERGWQYGKD